MLSEETLQRLVENFAFTRASRGLDVFDDEVHDLLRWAEEAALSLELIGMVVAGDLLIDCNEEGRPTFTAPDTPQRIGLQQFLDAEDGVC